MKNKKQVNYINQEVERSLSQKKRFSDEEKKVKIQFVIKGEQAPSVEEVTVPAKGQYCSYVRDFDFFADN